MSRKRIEIPADTRFGRLTVICELEADPMSQKNKRLFLCKCDCGNEVEVNFQCLRQGRTKSCGCFATERRSEVHKKYNTYEFQDDYVIGYTSDGKPFYIDVEDYEKVKPYCWRNDNGYLLTWLEQRKRVQLHRFLLEPPDGMEVDHINGNRNDNRRANIRVCTHTENNWNKKCKGYNWCNRRKIWRAYITVNGKNIHLGYYRNEQQACMARRLAEQKYFGEFAYKNTEQGVNNVT